jgi:hypothetical protein
MSNTGAVAKHISDMLKKTGEVMAVKCTEELREEKEDTKTIIIFTVQNYLMGNVCENVEIKIIFGGTTHNLRAHEKTYIKYFQVPTGCFSVSKSSLWLECIIQ